LYLQRNLAWRFRNIPLQRLRVEQYFGHLLLDVEELCFVEGQKT
jgi:hypothetical protein